MASTFYVEIISPERHFFKGDVETLIIPGLDGEIGVMRGHEPFITAVAEGKLQIKIDGVWKNAATAEGFAVVRGDRATLMLQSVQWPEEIDEARALEALRRAQDILRRQESRRTYLTAKASMARAMARLKVKHDSIDY